MRLSFTITLILNYVTSSISQIKLNQLDFLTTGLFSVEELGNIANSVVPFTEKQRNDIYALLIESDTEKLIHSVETSKFDKQTYNNSWLHEFDDATYNYELKKSKQMDVVNYFSKTILYLNIL